LGGVAGVEVGEVFDEVGAEGCCLGAGEADGLDSAAAVEDDAAGVAGEAGGAEGFEAFGETLAGVV